MHSLYVDVYRLGSKIPKRDHFGIHAKIEETILEILALTIRASLASKDIKRPLLEKSRTEIEVLKHLIRAMHELSIIQFETYLDLQKRLQEISKMANGWLRYVAQKERQSSF